jgi:GTPase SAR1 family protein
MFYDVSGYDAYRPLMLNYVYNSNAIVLVYDITSKTSFEYVIQWMTSLVQGSRPTLIVIANKNDKVSERRVKLKDALKAVNQFDTNVFVVECSADNGDNVGGVLDIIIREASRDTSVEACYSIREIKREIKNNNQCVIV